SLEDFRGKLVLLFFGFTHCPDVCPTTLLKAAKVKEQLGADAGKLQVLFVTVDPERDTAEVLSKYVPAFDPSFIGLRGDPAEIAKAAREFKVFYQKVPNRDGSSYNVDHTAASYILDTEGRLRLFVRHTQPVEEIAADLRQLL
ncbi:MAG: SCO family protein, partial [Lautropia sp.]